MKEDELLKEFLSYYDVNNNLGFDKVNYRKGASITASFGLSEGFEVLPNGSLEWGHVRIHTGVDRAHGRNLNEVKDVVMAPFDFESSRFEDYKGEIYGTLVILISEKFGFEFRIAHMFPEKILILDKLKNKKPITRDTVIGPTGGYGIGSGYHTHTEIKSLEESSPILEMLLEKKFENDIYKEFNGNEILKFYGEQEKFENATPEEIFTDFKKQKEIRRCYFANQYLYRYIDFDGTKKTRYSSELLFNGL